MSGLLYAERNPIGLDRAGNYYCKHVMAMTVEGLHSKSAIAMELGHRDEIIDEMKRAITVSRTDGSNSGRAIYSAKT